MEQNYYNFVTTLYKFLFDVNRYVPSPEVDKILEVYKDFDMKKVIILVHKIFKSNEDNINTNNANLFNQSFNILPSLDLSPLWHKMNPNQQKKIWTYMSMLLLQTDIFFSDDVPNVEVVDVKPVVPEFNPYIGVGNSTQTYGVNEMLSSIPAIEEDQPMGIGLDTVIKMTGLDKMIDFDKFKNELKNMTPEDIDNATNNLRQALGPDNNATGDLISSMLVNISDELKKDDKNLQKILESVATNVSSSVAENNITVPQLINSAKVFASQCKTPDGAPMFGNMNPFAMLEKCVGANGQVNEQEAAAECNNMLKTMGMGNIDMSNMANMNPMQMAMMFSQMQQGGQQPQVAPRRTGKKPKRVNNKK